MNNIYAASNAILRTLIRKAVEEENELNLQQKKPLQAAFYRFLVTEVNWKKRGFSSLFSVTTFIEKNTEKIIDLIVTSSCCQSCIYWKN